MADAREQVARVAEMVAWAHERDHLKAIKVGEVAFNTAETGLCAKFTRQCHESALGLAPFDWPYIAPNAILMEAALNQAGRKEYIVRRGDVVAINKGTGPHGHIGIYLGNGRFAENTSSKKRGPGTVISDLRLVQARITGYYNGCPKVIKQPAQFVKVVLQNGDDYKLIDCGAEYDGEQVTVSVPMLTHALELGVVHGPARQPLRPIAEAAGYVVNAEHLQGQRKVYLWER